MSYIPYSVEVAAGVHRIQTDYQDRYLFQHVLVGDDAALIVDAGVDSTPAEHLFPFLDALASSRTMYLLITHSDADHCGGAATLQRRYPNISTMAHWREVPLIEDPERNLEERYLELQPCGISYPHERCTRLRSSLGDAGRVDRILQGDERIMLSPNWELTLLYTPGHTAGHTVVLDARHRLAVVADACLGKAIPTRDGRAAFAPTYRYTDAYRGTISTLRGLSLDILLTSHFPRFEGTAVEQFLEESLAFTHVVERFLLQQLEMHSAVTVKQLLASADSSLGTWPTDRNLELWYCLQGGLESLESQAVVVHQGCAWRLTP